MINRNLIFKKRTNEGSLSFYKITEKVYEIPLDPFFLTELNYSNIEEKNSQCVLPEILTQPAIPIEVKIQTQSIQSTQNVLMETVNEIVI